MIKEKVLLFFILTLLWSSAPAQSFEKAGFRVDCQCYLTLDYELTALEIHNKTRDIIGVYHCFINKGIPSEAIAVNISVYDLDRGYRGLRRPDHEAYEDFFFREYENRLKGSGISFEPLRFQESYAIRYSFMQSGIPTNAIIFIKNKKAYHIEVLSHDEAARIKTYRQVVDSMVVF